MGGMHYFLPQVGGVRFIKEKNPTDQTNFYSLITANLNTRCLKITFYNFDTKGNIYKHRELPIKEIQTQKPPKFKKNKVVMISKPLLDISDF